MLSPINQYFISLEEPTRSFLTYIRQHLLKKDPAITEVWRYGMPFYCYKGKRFCYLWTEKKSGQPYLGIVDGHLIPDPDLKSEGRKRMKIFLFDTQKDIPIKKIEVLLNKAIRLIQ